MDEVTRQLRETDRRIAQANSSTGDAIYRGRPACPTPESQRIADAYDRAAVLTAIKESAASLDGIRARGLVLSDAYLTEILSSLVRDGSVRLTEAWFSAVLS